MSHHDVAQLYHLTIIPTKINFLHLKVSDIQPRQDFTHCPPGQLDAMVKTIPTQLWVKCMKIRSLLEPYKLQTLIYDEEYAKYSYEEV